MLAECLLVSRQGPLDFHLVPGEQHDETQPEEYRRTRYMVQINTLLSYALRSLVQNHM